MNYYAIFLIFIVLYFLVATKELFIGNKINTSNYPNSYSNKYYPDHIDDDRKYPSLIDGCQFYKYDLERMKNARTINTKNTRSTLIEGFNSDKCIGDECYCD